MYTLSQNNFFLLFYLFRDKITTLTFPHPWPGKWTFQYTWWHFFVLGRTNDLLYKSKVFQEHSQRQYSIYPKYGFPIESIAWLLIESTKGVVVHTCTTFTLSRIIELENSFEHNMIIIQMQSNISVSISFTSSSTAPVSTTTGYTSESSSESSGASSSPLILLTMRRPRRVPKVKH